MAKALLGGATWEERYVAGGEAAADRPTVGLVPATPVATATRNAMICKKRLTASDAPVKLVSEWKCDLVI